MNVDSPGKKCIVSFAVTQSLDLSFVISSCQPFLEGFWHSFSRFLNYLRIKGISAKVRLLTYFYMHYEMPVAFYSSLSQLFLGDLKPSQRLWFGKSSLTFLGSLKQHLKQFSTNSTKGVHLDDRLAKTQVSREISMNSRWPFNLQKQTIYIAYSWQGRI